MYEELRKGKDQGRGMDITQEITKKGTNKDIDPTTGKTNSELQAQNSQPVTDLKIHNHVG